MIDPARHRSTARLYRQCADRNRRTAAQYRLRADDHEAIATRWETKAANLDRWASLAEDARTERKPNDER